MTILHMRLGDFLMKLSECFTYDLNFQRTQARSSENENKMTHSLSPSSITDNDAIPFLHLQLL